MPIAAAPTQPKELPHFEPDIQVSIDPANKEGYRGRKFFLEDAQSYLGVNSDQTYVGRVLLSFSDYLGDHRIIANLSPIDALSNFDFIYADYSRRWHWQLEAFDTPVSGGTQVKPKAKFKALLAATSPTGMAFVRPMRLTAIMTKGPV